MVLGTILGGTMGARRGRTIEKLIYSIEGPQGGITAAPLFILGLLVDGLKANEVPS